MAEISHVMSEELSNLKAFLLLISNERVSVDCQRYALSCLHLDGLSCICILMVILFFISVNLKLNVSLALKKARNVQLPQKIIHYTGWNKELCRPSFVL